MFSIVTAGENGSDWLTWISSCTAGESQEELSMYLVGKSASSLPGPISTHYRVYEQSGSVEMVAPGLC